MSLDSYHQKRDFKKTHEPKGRVHKTKKSLYVIQKHAASHLHYDLRLELEGVLKSWAVPKGPCLDPKVKRLAIHVEDHPIEYGTFEGIIPKGEYGGGTVMLWDKGYWRPLDNDPVKAYQKGHLRFELNAEKLQGRWDLIRFKEKEWFFIKYKDEFAKPLEEYDITKENSLSLLHNQSMEEISLNYDGIWTKKGYKKKADSNLINSELKAKLGPASPFPTKISVQLATLVDKAPKGDEWLHEVKFDGYRMIAVKKGKQVTLMSRNEKDWTKEFKSLIPDIQKLPVMNALFDGEIVVLDKNSRSNFQLLQNSIKSEEQTQFYYYLFDLLYLEKYDLRSLALTERKSILASLLEKAPLSIKYSNHIVGHGEEMLERSCDFALEGMISKRLDSNYTGKRSKSWLKIKCSKRQEFVVGGFSKPKCSREYFGSLYLGVFNKEGELAFTGNVGTGFTAASLKAVYDELELLISKNNPFNQEPPEAKAATWVKPKLVVDVEFSQWTEDGRLRHPSFKGLRMDKKQKTVIKEKETAIEAVESTSKTKPLKLSHPEKILYKEDKISKQDLYHYYEEISDYILPYIKNRPLTLVRCPSGYEACFYQKHLGKGATKLHRVPVENKKGEIDQYIYLDNKAGLLNLVQLGVLEIHPWGSTIQQLEYPDILVLDLDPAPDVEWKRVVEAAFDVREQLSQYQLTSFVKTTGGKGLHIVIPIKPEYHWDDAKNFTRIFVEYLEKRSPKKYISKMSKAKRKGKIFIDYLRNQHGATAIAPYSTRARLHAPVATPLDWDELSNHFEDNFYTLRTLPKRLGTLKSDPWKAFLTISQSLRLDNL